MAALILQVASAVALVSTPVHASSSSSSSAASVHDVVINTIDICSKDEYVGNCWYPVTCQTCLTRVGCGVQVLTGRCVSNSSISEIATTSGSGAQYFLSGEVKYCGPIDQACFSCRRRDAPNVCISLNSDCICASQCELISTQPTKCNSGPASTSYGSLIAGAAVLFPLITYLIFKGSPCSAGCSFRRLLRRHQRDKNRRSLPGALELEAWRTERKEQVDDQFADLELRSCFVPMPSARNHHQHQPGSVETSAPVHVEAGDVAQAVEETDLPFSPTTGDRRRAKEVTTSAIQLV